MKMFFKKLISSALAAVLLTGCGTQNTADTPVPEASAAKDKIKIVTTIFPEYDWVNNIIDGKEDAFDVTLLLDSGADLHSFQPTAEDILSISSCDMFVYVGGESDGWVDAALENAKNSDIKVISLMEVMGENAKEEELKEGMQAEEEEEHEDEGREEKEYDEHVWLSVRNAKLFCGAIKDAVCALDPENAEIYKNNTYAYTEQLETLDADFAELAENSADKTLIFGDRFPFRYFTDDYGLDYYAAFVGCSAETEANVDTIVFLAKKVDETGAGTIYTIENSDQKIALAIKAAAQNKDIKTAVLDSMQAVTAKQAAEGTSYLSVMRKNYEVLSEGLK